MKRVLLIDDDKNEHTLVKAYLLARFGENHTFSSALTLSEAKQALTNQTFDLVFLDNRLHPHQHFLETLPQLTSLLKAARTFVISASIEELPVPVPHELGLEAYIDKFDLRKDVLSGRFD